MGASPRWKEIELDMYCPGRLLVRTVKTENHVTIMASKSVSMLETDVSNLVLVNFIGQHGFSLLHKEIVDDFSMDGGRSEFSIYRRRVSIFKNGEHLLSNLGLAG
ncbi:hypothetical protein HMPREF9336_04183 [Segniliparus rugosus ATCC BAA-974]|uniref:Uncharacterized protein n=1 Tax=Segniliparus rugosus (strain ATCC BAA-974 / DSM 45345 / CCUG 50838 / CIP 108380 / JCM 13579 / CDC 945) TaxID=679197 RepID=U1M1P1_SEGRC|nr:hypothetical protein HMPREF9336_04183 [Segniliparus rugosus ATCC BAA-974]